MNLALLKKISVPALIVIATVATIVFTYKTGYSNGELSQALVHNQEQQRLLAETQRRAAERTRLQIQQLQDEHARELARERQRAQTNVRIEEIIKYVDREIVVTAECDAISNHVISVLEQATDTVRGN